MNPIRTTLILALAAGLGSCGKDTVAPVAGDLTISYSSGAGNDGALLVLVTGAVTGVHPLAGLTASSAPSGTTGTRIVLTGAIEAGDVVTVTVPDLAAASSYTVTVEAAADRSTFALADPTLYTASIRK